MENGELLQATNHVESAFRCSLNTKTPINAIRRLEIRLSGAFLANANTAFRRLGVAFMVGTN